MQFQKVYIEITNICGLKCDFCPQKNAPSQIMKLEFFERVLKEIKPYTKEIALHVMGDPLTLSNLNDYLDLTLKYDIKVNITTSGAYLKNHANLFHQSVKQINISLNSFNKNSYKCSFDEYMQSIFELIEKRENKECFINLRLWNLDEQNSEKIFNEKVYKSLEEYFETDLKKSISQSTSKAIRLDRKILLHFDNYFEWPSLESSHFSHGFCHGLSSQIAILANGCVVPCCLDNEGKINLGSLHVNTLQEILKTQKVKHMIEEFKKKKAIEKLCQKCKFKDRFNK